MLDRIVTLGLAASLALSATPAVAKDIVVQMKNRGAAGFMVFEPAYVEAKPGDTIRFVPTDAGHNAQTIAGFLPDGVAPSTGQIGKEFDLKVTKAGLYGVACQPHFGMGMVALIKVGTGPAPNAAKARAAKLPPLAVKRMAPLLAKAGG
jgi:pseudoazurin